MILFRKGSGHISRQTAAHYFTGPTMDVNFRICGQLLTSRYWMRLIGPNALSNLPYLGMKATHVIERRIFFALFKIIRLLLMTTS
jgi:hypothetical protein